MYAWSFAEDGYYYGEFETYEEALADAREQVKEYGKGKSIPVYVGKTEHYCPSPTCFDVIESIREDLDSQCDDMDWYLEDVSSEEEDELENMLLRTFLKWAKKHGYEPSNVWYVPVSTIKKVTL
jgi:hypothetical protein